MSTRTEIRTSLKNRTDKSIGHYRYEVYDADTNQHLGWVVRSDMSRKWSAYIAEDVNPNTEGYCSQMAVGSISLGYKAFDTRQEAIDEITLDLHIRFSYHIWNQGQEVS